MVRSIDRAAEAGDVVQVYDKHGKLFGRGLYHGNSNITIRMLTHGDRPVDDAFWRDALNQAVSLRRDLQLDDVTDAYRLVHAEGDGLSGLIVERYADCLVFEVFSAGMFIRAQMIAGILKELLGKPTSLDRPDATFDDWRVIVRADDRIQRIEQFSVPEAELGGRGTVTIREHGVRYRVDMTGGHKTGFFCDQRDNRLRLSKMCRDANVLDLCCYSGGFGLCAKTLGGAKEVTSIDLDEAAIEIAKKNADLNNQRIKFAHADAFIYLRQMIDIQRQFDVVVCDPPKFATSREEYDLALRKYYDLNALAMQVVRPGGVLLTCSCSGLVSMGKFVDTVEAAARRAGRTLQRFELCGAAPDHPVMTNCPESEYLKAYWCRVM
ncbi:MAG: class I SAM-dependent rRNA methyltransferase [Phycisphaerales bacterium]|nr:class I SAM-dependent rRNA methyltransferase [Phycisphaerales bacterium]MCB9856171.1 class I SAM-dependent rRNA methyltransferase [Phycisphaerales bacterium]